MLLKISHETRFVYSDPVAETVLKVRMAPSSDEDQTALGYRLRIAPRATVTSYRDGFANRVDLFNVLTPYQELVVQATSHVRTHRRPCRLRLDASRYDPAAAVDVDALEFLAPSALVDRSAALDACADELRGRLPSPGHGSLAEVVDLVMGAVRDRLKYEKKVTTAKTPLSEALGLGRGVCQDFAHMFIGGARQLGVPTRYVSGYVNHPGEIATHAWCQVWAGPTLGWVDVDPTHGCLPGDDHVVTAVGRDYADVPPNRGLWRGKATELIKVTVTVEPVDRLPDQWNEWGPAAPVPIGFGNGGRNGHGGPAGGQSPSNGRRADRRAYPVQSQALGGMRQQQGQQQQARGLA